MKVFISQKIICSFLQQDYYWISDRLLQDLLERTKKFFHMHWILKVNKSIYKYFWWTCACMSKRFFISAIYEHWYGLVDRGVVLHQSSRYLLDQYMAFTTLQLRQLTEYLHWCNLDIPSLHNSAAVSGRCPPTVSTPRLLASGTLAQVCNNNRNNFHLSHHHHHHHHLDTRFVLSWSSRLSLQ